jgi:hypothetical protein
MNKQQQQKIKNQNTNKRTEGVAQMVVFALHA